MKKRHTPEQIVGLLRQIEKLRVDKGLNQQLACREVGVTYQTYLRWRKEYGGLEKEEAKRLKELEKENARLKKIVADQALDISILKDVSSKKW